MADLYWNLFSIRTHLQWAMWTTFFTLNIDPCHDVGDHWPAGLEGPHACRPLLLNPHGGTQDCKCDILTEPYHP